MPGTAPGRHCGRRAGKKPGNDGQAGAGQDSRDHTRQGDRPVTRVADNGGYLGRLGDKLGEEAQEVRDADREHQAEELADTLEVIDAIADQIGVSMGELEKIREDKAAERGGFGGRIVSLGNEEPGE